KVAGVEGGAQQAVGRMQRVLDDMCAVGESAEESHELVDLGLRPGLHLDERGRQVVLRQAIWHGRRVALEHENMGLEIAASALPPGKRSSCHDSRIDVVVDLKDPVSRQMLEVSSVGLCGMQIGGGHRAGAARYARARVVGEDLDDVVA